MDLPNRIEAWGGYHLEALDPDSLLSHLDPPHCDIYDTHLLPHMQSEAPPTIICSSSLPAREKIRDLFSYLKKLSSKKNVYSPDLFFPYLVCSPSSSFILLT